MRQGRFVLPLILMLSAASVLAADEPLSPLATAAVLARIQAQRAELGLDSLSDFQVRSAFTDELGFSHVRFQQFFQGVQVWGGQAIAHTDADGHALALTDVLYRGIRLSVQPSLTPSEALAVAHADLAPRGPYAHPPTVEMVIYPVLLRTPRPGAPADPSATDMVSRARDFVLAYHVHTQLENPLETAHTDYLIDAQTGAILKMWDTLHTGSALGTGLTQYDGSVRLNTSTTAKGFALRDLTRGKGGAFGHNAVTNLDHGTTGKGALYAQHANTWGNHANYIGSETSTTGATGQTAAADAAYGVQVTWDMYKNVFGRKGIDGAGKATYSRVHYDTSFDNAFWDDDCFCMTYGDGDAFKSLESLDVAGHEMTHGVCSSSADLDYNGEPGGLNEANSDIFATMTEFYAKGGGFAVAARTLPASGGNWTIGEQLSDSPLRYLYKPSKDGISPDEWSEDLGDLDVHYSSGPMNRCFYFLSQGASASVSDEHTGNLPKGMKGLGNQMAARIWYRALTSYLTSASNYAAARTAAIRAAKDLYGPGSRAEQAVWRAFHGIKVGPDWTPARPHPSAPSDW